MVFDTEDSTSGKKRNKPSSVPGSMQQPNAGGVGRGGWVGGLGVMGEGRERRGSAPTWGSNDPNKLHALHERQSQLQSNPYGHASLPESQMSRPPVPTPRRDQPGSQPKPPSGPSPAEREKMKQEEQRQGRDILTPGIATEVHGMAEGVIGEMEEAGGGHEVTGTPYDPNLTCIFCNRMSTPFSSLTSDTATHTHESSSTPTAEPEGEERGEGMLSTSEDHHHTVSGLKQELLKLYTMYQKAENRAGYFEEEYHELMKTHLNLKQDFQEKEKAMKKTAEELERTKSSIQRHSTAQSQQILVLQDEAKVRAKSLGTSTLFRGYPFFGDRNVWTMGGG